MRRIVYYVAVSLDGYIAGTNGSVEGFLLSGQGVDKYLSDLLNFDTVIMGRNTYEFGYQFGLQPGQPAYAHMKHYIFSEHLHFENPHPNVYVKKAVIEEVEHIQKQEGTDIYLCGGGQLAGWLLDYQKIEILKIATSYKLQIKNE
ncbi:MAG: dihydrofolate reductase [Bacteroidetes bacterium]|nr:MAG: dihydrofolate reductase [Bacteroidota bacterium]